MQFRFTTLLALLLIPKESLQECFVIGNHPTYYNGIRRFSYSYDKYILCQNTPITSDFDAKVKPLLEQGGIRWIAINDSISPEIPPGAFSTLEYLSDLRINSAGVQAIQPGSLDGLVRLTKLSLRNNKISSLNGKCFQNLTRLEELDLSFNNIATIENTTFTNLTKLHILILQNNFITNLPTGLFKNQFVSIGTLDLSFNKFDTISNDLLKLKYLANIYLNNNKLSYLNGNFLNSSISLKNVYLSHNNLINLKNLSFAKTLTYLNISHNLIKTLSFSNRADLETLDLSANGMISTENLIFTNVSLHQIYLDENLLGISPSQNLSFTTVARIEVISLASNKLRQINTDFFKNNPRVTRLNLTNNYLRTINVTNIPFLQFLNLSYNYFNSSLNLTGLSNLRELDISFNSLTQVSLHLLTGLSQLQKLNLNNNIISKLDLGCFKDLKRLIELNLSNNRISTLNLGVFSGLINLQRLDLSNNKLVDLKDGTFHTIRYLYFINLSKTTVSYSYVDNILSHSPMMREIGIAENGWSCRALTRLIEKRRSIKLLNSGDFNVTNVDGVACEYGEERSEDLADIVNTEIKNFDIFDGKLATMNTLLILILIVLIIQIALKYIPFKLNNNKLKNIASRSKSEQELQLVGEEC